MLTFFRKDTFQSFFLLNVNNKNNYINTLVTNKSQIKLLSVNTYNKSEPSSNKYNYIYKPDNLLSENLNLEYYFVRKSKNFNKGRYSRNRQVYRTGVYVCFYVNVIALYLL